MSDEGRELEPTPGLFRGLRPVNLRWQVSSLDRPTWEAAGASDKVRVPPFSLLLLDASRLAESDLGAGIAVAYTALEVLIGWALDVLVKATTIPEELWAWVNERRREPSIREQLDNLLRIVGGKSLTENATLSQTLTTLSEMRNSFVH